MRGLSGIDVLVPGGRTSGPHSPALGACSRVTSNISWEDTSDRIYDSPRDEPSWWVGLERSQSSWGSDLFGLLETEQVRDAKKM